MSYDWSAITSHLGRILLASLFVLGGINKLATYGETAAAMDGVGLVPSALLLPATIALELGAGLALAIGARFAASSALALAVFTIATNVVFHRFWDMSGDIRDLELSLFFKNIAIAGGLLFAVGVLWRGPVGRRDA